jgi:hypothetical protein
MDRIVYPIVVSPSGTRHYVPLRQRRGLPRALCGTGIDRAAGWGAVGRGTGWRDCRRCEGLVR